MFEENVLDYPGISPDDVSQEVAIQEFFTGRKLSKRWVFLAMRDDNDVLIYGLEPPPNACSAFSPEPCPSFEDIEDLVNWALDQGPEIFQLIDWFLDDPKDRLELTLTALAYRGLIPKGEVDIALNFGKSNFTELVRRQFAKYEELSYDYICDLAKIECVDTKDTSDLVYRTLRQLEESGEVEYLGGGLYRWLDPKQP